MRTMVRLSPDRNGRREGIAPEGGWRGEPPLNFKLDDEDVEEMQEEEGPEEEENKNFYPKGFIILNIWSHESY